MPDRKHKPSAISRTGIYLIIYKLKTDHIILFQLISSINIGIIYQHSNSEPMMMQYSTRVLFQGHHTVTVKYQKQFVYPEFLCVLPVKLNPYQNLADVLQPVFACYIHYRFRYSMLQSFWLEEYLLSELSTIYKRERSEANIMILSLLI